MAAYSTRYRIDLILHCLLNFRKDRTLISNTNVNTKGGHNFAGELSVILNKRTGGRRIVGFIYHFMTADANVNPEPITAKRIRSSS